jgi:hypothetical protein
MQMLGQTFAVLKQMLGAQRQAKDAMTGFARRFPEV